MAPNTYSTVVTWVKIILPILALALLSTLFLFSSTPDPEAAIPFATVNVEELAAGQRLGAPRLAGTLSDGREIVFTAETASPVATAPRQFQAARVEARLDLTPQEVLFLVAGTGLFDTGAQTAELRDEVQLTSSSGFQISTAALTLDLASSEARAGQELRLTGPGIELTAGQMTARTGPEGAGIVFNDGVRVLYSPQD